MLFQIYGPMFLIIAVAASLASLFFVGATLLGPKKPTAEKMLPFAKYNLRSPHGLAFRGMSHQVGASHSSLTQESRDPRSVLFAPGSKGRCCR